MKILVDQEAKTRIEDLCHVAMVNTSRESFLSNLVAINKTLMAVELIPAVPDEKPATDNAAG